MAVTDPGKYAFDVPRRGSPYWLHKKRYRHKPEFFIPKRESPYWTHKHDMPLGPGGQPVGDDGAPYIMEPGARLEVSNRGRLYETMGQDTGAALAGAGKSLLLIVGVAAVVGFAFLKAPKRAR